jgi:hypothetical protein
LQDVEVRILNPTVQPPSHQVAVWDSMERFKYYTQQSMSNSITKLPAGMEHLALIKDNDAALPTCDEQKGGKEAQQEAAAT